MRVVVLLALLYRSVVFLSPIPNIKEIKKRWKKPLNYWVVRIPELLAYGGM
jgi:hypothetical protein